MTSLHADVAPLGFLLGTWRGEGRGHYPTIEPFSYGEEVHFHYPGKPFLAYAQRTWALDDGRGLHAESGYWRLRDGTRVELLLAHPTGLAEVAEGHLEGTTITLETTTLGRSASAKRVDRVRRVFRVDGDTLSYQLHMAAVAQPLQEHLVAHLHRRS